MPMDTNRIKQISPSVARLKYDKQHNNQSKTKQEKQKLQEKNMQNNSADNGKVIDDFA